MKMLIAVAALALSLPTVASTSLERDMSIRERTPHPERVVAMLDRAADMGPQLAVAQAEPAPAPAPAPDPMSLVQSVWDAVVNKQWWLAASFAVVFIVWGLRAVGSKLSPKLAAFLANPMVAFALPTLVAVAGAVINSIGAGMPIQAALLAALKVAAGAVFAYVFARKLAEAKAAGDAAAAKVVSLDDAHKVFNGPQP